MVLLGVLVEMEKEYTFMVVSCVSVPEPDTDTKPFPLTDQVYWVPSTML